MQPSCRSKLPSVTYIGHIFSSDGLSPDPEKVKAIIDMPRPTDVQGVLRLIGVVTYLAKFLPELSTVCEPLRHLTDKDVNFDWLQHHDTTLDKINKLITEAPVLSYYDANQDVVIECLAIVFVTHRFEQYILGRDKVLVLTDHKPLMNIFKKPILVSPKRLQRMRLRLHKYSLHLEYKRGSRMYLSDTLSQAALPMRQVTDQTPDYLIFSVTQ